MKESMGSFAYEALIAQVPNDRLSDFNCLKPNCGSSNVVEEDRKRYVVQILLNVISFRVSSGEEFDAVMADVPAPCDCLSPFNCACP